MSLRRNWDSPSPSPAKRVCPTHRTKGWGAHSPTARRVRELKFRRLRKSLALCLLCALSPTLSLLYVYLGQVTHNVYCKVVYVGTILKGSSTPRLHGLDPGDLHCKKMLPIFPSPGGMSLTKLNKIGDLFLQCRRVKNMITYVSNIIQGLLSQTGQSSQSTEYLMNYRGPGFLAVAWIWFFAHPPPPRQ